MVFVRDAASLSDANLEERKKHLEESIKSAFDPASILFSALLAFAIKQLVKWLEGKLSNKEIGDDD